VSLTQWIIIVDVTSKSGNIQDDILHKVGKQAKKEQKK
jgi:hypothetical protein